ncbi:MAG: hypothetical protein GC189_08995 [Alphaproteobacteria bacterium]|nr:hypothetical protein [Alphaproteobacteria bacterium]
MSSLIATAVQALGGIVGANIFGAMTRGGGAFVRTLVGAAAGVGAAWALQMNAPATFDWFTNLTPGEAGRQFGYLLIGAGGGALVGLLVGVMFAPRG